MRSLTRAIVQVEQEKVVDVTPEADDAEIGGPRNSSCVLHREPLDKIGFARHELPRQRRAVRGERPEAGVERRPRSGIKSAWRELEPDLRLPRYELERSAADGLTSVGTLVDGVAPNAAQEVSRQWRQSRDQDVESLGRALAEPGGAGE